MAVKTIKPSTETMNLVLLKKRHMKQGVNEITGSEVARD